MDEIMTQKEFDILVFLSEQKSAFSQRMLSQNFGLSLGSVNKIVQNLMDKNFVDSGFITSNGIATLEPFRVRRAIFLAAGFGSRLVPITFNTPKPLVRVNGTRMIDTLLDAVTKAQIPEIIIVRGYLGEQFDQLLYKYPSIKFVENPIYNEANNIASAELVRYNLQNAYVMEADLVLKNPHLIRKYEFSSNFLGIPVDVTDDWCIHTDKNGIITEETIGGKNCYQMVGISYWDAADGAKLANDLDEVYRSPGGKERYWEQTALVYKKENYKVSVRECSKDDITEIDTFGELKKIDKLYEQG